MSVAMNPADDRSAAAQAQACHQAALFYSGRQSGPRPASKEAVFFAGLLFEAEATLRAFENQNGVAPE